MLSRQLAIYPVTPGATAPFNTTPEFEAALGASLGLVMAFVDNDHGTSNIQHSIDVHLEVVGKTHPSIWTVGICNDLSEMVKGVEDASLKAEAVRIAAEQPTGPIIIRLMHEPNGIADYNTMKPNYPRWFGPGREPMWKQGYIRAVDIFRSVSPRFLFDWCMQHTAYIDGKPYDPRLLYPGGDHLDFIGLDAYLDKNDSPDDATAVAWKKWGQGVGSDMIAAFAKSEGKRMSLAEWGIFRDSPLFVKYIADLVESADVAFHSYFNTGIWQLKQFPKAQAAYRQRFGQPSFLGLGTNYTATPGQSLGIPLKANQVISKYGVTGTGCQISGSNLIVAPMSAGSVVSATVRAINAYGIVGSQKITIRA